MSLSARIQSATLRDFRAFPAGSAPTVFEFGDNGKNLLLFGENGAGKSSLFLALKLLFSPSPPAKAFIDYHHVFTKDVTGTNPGLVAVKMTAGTSQDYTWDSGNPHPATNSRDETFREIARRATFLDYKALLKTSLPHEDNDRVDLFELVVKALLRNATFDGKQTVFQAWEELLAFQPKPPPPKDADESDDDYKDTVQHWPSADQQKRDAAESFWQLLGNLLGKIVPAANRFLAEHLQPSLTIELTPQPEKQADGNPHRKLLLTAKYANHLVEHPAQFLNEARLSAIAIALYLAAVVETTPAGTLMPALSGIAADSFRPARLLVLDDPLLGLDLSHRLPLLDLLQGAEFADWQIVLLTFDANWFEMASDRLPNDSWVKYRLHAKAHQEGWEIPISELDAPYLNRAWKHIQDGDFKGAGVYLRTAWENVMRTFCETHHQLKVPLKRQMHEYKAEDFWPLVKTFEFKPANRLVDPPLAEEIEICRRYVLNPLCHNDPARPTREEVRRAHSAVSRLKILLEQQASWILQLDSKLRAATVQIIGDNEKLRERALKGLALPDNFALHCAGQLLAAKDPPIFIIAPLLRSAFDQALWKFCVRRAINFAVTCDAPLTTERLWVGATVGASGLGATQAAFVAVINAHTNLMLADSPDNEVFAAKSLVDLQGLFAALRGGSPANAPKMIMDSW